jgi:hypothetical protein
MRTCLTSPTCASIHSSARAGTKEGAQQYFDWFKFRFWRFVFVQQVNGQGNPYLPGISADAARRELQPRRNQGEMAKRMAEAETEEKGPSN